MAPLVADPPNANSPTYTDTHILSDIGDTWSTLSYGHSLTDTDTQRLNDLGDTL